MANTESTAPTSLFSSNPITNASGQPNWTTVRKVTIILALLLLTITVANELIERNNQPLTPKLNPSSQTPPSTTSSASPTMVPAGWSSEKTYSGKSGLVPLLSPKGNFILHIPTDCVVAETQVTIACYGRTGRFTIDPQAKADRIPQTTLGKITIGSRQWDTGVGPDMHTSAYQLTESGIPYLFTVTYEPFDVKAQMLVESILASFTPAP